MAPANQPAGDRCRSSERQRGLLTLASASSALLNGPSHWSLSPLAPPWTPRPWLQNGQPARWTLARSRCQLSYAQNSALALIATSTSWWAGSTTPGLASVLTPDRLARV